MIQLFFKNLKYVDNETKTIFFRDYLKKVYEHYKRSELSILLLVNIQRILDDEEEILSEENISTILRIFTDCCHHQEILTRVSIVKEYWKFISVLCTRYVGYGFFGDD